MCCFGITTSQVWNNFKPRPQNRIREGLFSKFPTSTPVFYVGVHSISTPGVATSSVARGLISTEKVTTRKYTDLIVTKKYEKMGMKLYLQCPQLSKVATQYRILYRILSTKFVPLQVRLERAYLFIHKCVNGPSYSHLNYVILLSKMTRVFYFAHLLYNVFWEK